MRRLAEAARRRDGGAARQRAHTNAPVPDRGRLYADIAMLLWQDLAKVEAGLYPLPADHDASLLTLPHRSLLFFEDLPEILSAPRKRRTQRSLEREDYRERAQQIRIFRLSDKFGCPNPEAVDRDAPGHSVSPNGMLSMMEDLIRSFQTRRTHFHPGGRRRLR
jgi:hypothetical protein